MHSIATVAGVQSVIRTVPFRSISLNACALAAQRNIVALVHATNPLQPQPTTWRSSQEMSAPVADTPLREREREERE